MRNRKQALIIFVILAAILAGSMLLAGAFGAVSISPLSIIKMSLDKLPFVDFDTSWRSTHEVILFQIRLPRVLAGALIGAGLGAAGALFQGLLRNPLADPYIIGTAAGAGFGVTLAMMLPVSSVFFGFGLVPIAAFLGALATVMFVYNLARVGGRSNVISILLAGFAISSLLAAVMMLLITVSGQRQLQQIFAFLMGGISVSDWSQLAVIAPLIIGGIILARFFAFHLNAFSLGEEGAAYLGINVERDKFLILGLGALLTAAAVTLGGLIGFVGLVVPHAVRLVLGPDHRLLLPAAALVGASFLILADLAARTVLAPAELPVGVFTALIGAPFFIYLLRRSRKEYAF